MTAPAQPITWHPSPSNGAQSFDDSDALDRRLLSQPAEWRCFPTEWHYRRWRALATKRMLPCVDCTPEWRDAMAARGRCRHPDTSFQAVRSELIGRAPPDNLDASPAVVELACMLLGREAMGPLLGISMASLPHYRNGNRVLPAMKFASIRAALHAAARLLTNTGEQP